MDKKNSNKKQTNPKIQANTTQLIFHIIRYILINYFIDLKDYETKYSKDICNLLCTSRYINDLMISIFLKYCYLPFRGAISTRQNLQNLILRLSFSQGDDINSINSIIGVTPCLRELIINTKNYYLPLKMSCDLPKTLISLYLPHVLNLSESMISIQFPQNLKSLKLNDSWNDEINDLPHGLTQLTFGHNFNKSIYPGNLHQDLRTLNLGLNFDQFIIPGSLPQSITSLGFGMFYDKPISSNTLPHSITKLNFGTFFNHSLVPDVLPKSLINLIFGDSYNQLFEPNVLPESLKSLSVGENYDKPLFCLPYGLKSLCLKPRYTHSLLHLSKLEKLEFSHNNYPYGKNTGCAKNIENLLPLNIKVFAIYDCAFNRPLDKYCGSMNQLLELHLHGTYTRTLNKKTDTSSSRFLPLSLKKIVFEKNDDNYDHYDDDDDDDDENDDQEIKCSRNELIFGQNEYDTKWEFITTDDHLIWRRN